MRLTWLVLITLVFFSSCETALRDKDPMGPPEATGPDFTYNQEQAEVSVTTPTAILAKGNNISSGLPGFGENAIRAIMGQYRFEIPGIDSRRTDTGSAMEVTVWLSSEFIFISPGTWTPRQSLAAYQARERRDDSGLYIILGSINTAQDKWTALFFIPGETENAGMTPDYTDRLIRAWVSRLSYFISISPSDTQVSLPAVVSF